MYSFEPSEEQQMLIDTAGKYAATDLRPAARDADESRNLPMKTIRKGWELGLLQASIPQEYGGFGEHSHVTSALAVEELAYGDLAGAFAVLTPALFAIPILLAGSEDQKKEYLPAIVEAEWHPYTAALIEYTFDFDPKDLRTTAKQVGSDYVLTGEKAMVPFAKDAEVILVYANHDGHTQGFILSRDSSGLSVSAE